MKTQKQLPNDFTFICDIKSRSQLDKLKIDTNGYEINLLNRKYAVSGGKVYCPADNSMLPLINLSDYIDQEQPELIGTIPASKSVITSVLSGFNGSMEFKTDGNRIPIGPKWQDKTRGGMEFLIFEYFNNSIFGRIKADKEWIGLHWRSDGKYYETANDVWDLLPYNSELTTLEKELEEVRLKEKELLEKIEQLKTK